MTQHGVDQLGQTPAIGMPQFAMCFEVLRQYAVRRALEAEHFGQQTDRLPDEWARQCLFGRTLRRQLFVPRCRFTSRTGICRRLATNGFFIHSIIPSSAQ